MGFNGSGLFEIDTAGQPVVSATTISSSDFNALTADLATGLSTCITKDGQTTVTANIPMATYKITGLGAGTARTDAASLATIQDGTGVYVGTVGGTADVITLTPSPAITAYAAGQTFRFIASGENTTNVTVNVSGLGAKAITKNGTTALVAGDIPASMMVTITYDGTRFILASVQPFGVLNAAGDIIYASAADTPARLAIGTARQALTVNAGATAPAWSNPITLGTPQATTSGTSIDFTGIPAGVRRVTIMFNGVSTNGTTGILIIIGDSGGLETSGYVSSGASIITTSALTSNSTAGYMINSLVAATALGGSVVLTLENTSNNTWTAQGVLSDTGYVFMVSGRKSLSATLDRVSIRSVNGVDTFDAGEVNISYE